MEFKDYYKVLGVPRDASADAIKKAYRQLARKYHPDVSTEADAAKRMAEVNEANTVLSDAERRAEYDQMSVGQRDGEAFRPPPGWEGFRRGAPQGGARRPEGGGFEGFEGFESFDGDHSDFFSELFGRAQRAGAGARGAGARPMPDQRGEDVHAEVELDIADSFHGATRMLSLRVPTVGDDGRVRLNTRTLEVKIPIGVRPGQLIRLAGQGGAGWGKGAPGDLLMEVRFRDDARFKVHGVDLAADLPVAPWEAALGAVVPVERPDGSTLKVRVPQGAQSGQVLTVRGKGFPGNNPTDLELRLVVVLPSGYDPRAKALYEQMAAALPDFDARKVVAAERARGDRGDKETS